MATLLNKTFRAKNNTTFYKAAASGIAGGTVYTSTGEKIPAGSEIIITTTSKTDAYSSPQNMIIGVTQNGKIVNMNDFEIKNGDDQKGDADSAAKSFPKKIVIGAIIVASLTVLVVALLKKNG